MNKLKQLFNSITGNSLNDLLKEKRRLVTVKTNKSRAKTPDKAELASLETKIEKLAQKINDIQSGGKLKYTMLKDTITVKYSGQMHVVKSGDARFEKIKEAILSKNLSAIPKIVEIERYFKAQGLEFRSGILYYKGEELPSELGKRIMEFKESGTPFKYLLKFWDNLKQNPSFNSRSMLFKFLDHNGHPFTKDGEFLAYRGVREDYKDQHTGTFDNKPGSVLEMDRSMVDDNPNNTCSSGFHVACYDYAKSFAPKLLEVKVNPRDVVAVPNDYNGTKMRVSRFEVVKECEKMNTDVLYDKDDSDVEAEEEHYDTYYQ